MDASKIHLYILMEEMDHYRPFISTGKGYLVKKGSDPRISYGGCVLIWHKNGGGGRQNFEDEDEQHEAYKLKKSITFGRGLINWTLDVFHFTHDGINTILKTDATCKE